MTVEVNFIVGGEAGQGVQSVGYLLSKALARGGYHVFADQDYESRVRGGHNFFRVRAGRNRVSAIASKVDVLIALNRESIDLHRGELADDGVCIFDDDRVKGLSGGWCFGVPMQTLSKDKLANTVALGAVLGIAGFDVGIAEGVLLDHFKKGDVGESNVMALRAGCDYARAKFKGGFERRLPPIGDTKRMLINGNEAISLGAIAAGCKFMAAYPMTPATSIMEYFAAKSTECDLVMVHAEDEIAAVNMALGAVYAGVRAMTATSGSGFCLMVEGLGLAGITETPVVIIDAQRPGPAVGLPTRTEQGDLAFAVHAHHGDFPRAVLAPATVEDAFGITVKAFNLAERYQIPVLILTDHHLASSYATVERFDLSQITVDRGELFSPQGPGQAEYKRHVVTHSGVSPRAFPGMGEALVVTDGDEHGEDGHLVEDAAVRKAQMQKRLRKNLALHRDISPPMHYGPKHADVALIGWGSTYGAICEAVDILRRDGASVNALHFNEVWPLPVEAVTDVIDSARGSYVVEGNAAGQLYHLIAAETGRRASGRILKFDGRPLTPEYIVNAAREECCGL